MPDEIEEFRIFAKDHIKHFNAIPLEFEDSTGYVFGPEWCWATAIKIGLTELLQEDK